MFDAPPQNAEAHRPFTENETVGLQLESLLQHSLAALDHRDRRGRELNVGDAGGPVRVRTTGFGRGRRRRRCRGNACAQVAILDLSRRNGHLAARLHRRFVLARRGVAALVRAERRRAAGGVDGNRHIAVAQARETETRRQGRAIVGKRRVTALEVNAGRVKSPVLRSLRGAEREESI